MGIYGFFNVLSVKVGTCKNKTNFRIQEDLLKLFEISIDLHSYVILDLSENLHFHSNPYLQGYINHADSYMFIVLFYIIIPFLNPMNNLHSNIQQCKTVFGRKYPNPY